MNSAYVVACHFALFMYASTVILDTSPARLLLKTVTILSDWCMSVFLNYLSQFCCYACSRVRFLEGCEVKEMGFASQLTNDLNSAVSEH